MATDVLDVVERYEDACERARLRDILIEAGVKDSTQIDLQRLGTLLRSRAWVTRTKRMKGTSALMWVPPGYYSQLDDAVSRLFGKVEQDEGYTIKDLFELSGLSHISYRRSAQLFGRALRKAGWFRKRRRLDGVDSRTVLWFVSQTVNAAGVFAENWSSVLEIVERHEAACEELRMNVLLDELGVVDWGQMDKQYIGSLLRLRGWSGTVSRKIDGRFRSVWLPPRFYDRYENAVLRLAGRVNVGKGYPIQSLIELSGLASDLNDGVGDKRAWKLMGKALRKACWYRAYSHSRKVWFPPQALDVVFEASTVKAAVDKPTKELQSTDISEAQSDVVLHSSKKQRILHAEPLYELVYFTPQGQERVACSFCEVGYTGGKRRRRAYWTKTVNVRRRRYAEWIQLYYCKECGRELKEEGVKGLLPL